VTTSGPTPEEKTEVQRNAVALMLGALRQDETAADQAGELLSQLSHLDLIPVVLLLAHLAARVTTDEHGTREAARAALEQQLIDLAARPA